MSDALFAQPRRKAGTLETALARTLAAWAVNGHMTGDVWAADRAVLRDLARAADLARADAFGGEGSPWVLSQTGKAFREALESYRAQIGGDSVDAIDALIANISGPAVRDTP